MLTDEELKELESAVDIYYSGHANHWPRAANTCVQFTRNAIAREHAMRQPLTAEICERLGMVKRYDGDAFVILQDRLNKIHVEFFFDKTVVLNQAQLSNPTVGHLFAAAKLAGVELDWRKVGE